jgi:carboxyl-terminal processing protease
MMRLFRLAAFGMAVLLAPYQSARAAEEKSAPHPFAIIIGPAQFSDPQLKPHPTAEADAKAFYDLVTDKAVLGAEPDHVHLLISGKDEQRHAKEATKDNIIKAFKDVTTRADKDDLVLVAIVGQGAASADRTCIFATDSTFKDRAKNAFFAQDIEEEVKRLKSQELCVLLDINFKGFDPGKETVAEPSIRDFLLTFLGARDKEEQTLPPGRAVILARGGSTAPPLVTQDKVGLFTKVTIDALRGAADKEGYEPDGVVTVDELLTYLDSEVPPLARKLGKTPEEQQQLPFLEFARTSHYVLTHNPAATPKVEATIKKLDELATQQKLEKDVVEQGRLLLSRMPKLKALQELRKDYEKLTEGNLAVNDFLETRTKLMEGMKLARDAANSYAVKVSRGLKMVQGDYIKTLNLSDMTGQAIRGLYQRIDEKMPAQLRERVDKVKDLKEPDLIALLTDAREPLGKREDLDANKDVEISLQSAMAKLDPYSTFIDKESVERANQSVQGFFSGIGVQIRPDMVRDGLLVVTPIRGSPAYKAGLKAGDLIVKLRRPVDSNGEKLDPPQEVSTKGMKVDEAVKLILGKPKTDIEIFVEREGVKEPLQFKLKRDRVEVETVLGHERKTDDSWSYYIDPKNKIAYIYLTQFARKSYEDMEAVVKQLDKDGVKGIILDLRFNPGGYLDVARDISDLFIDDGLIVTIKNRAGKSVDMRGKQEPSYLNPPMVVLTNGGSASGSEIVAACLQDHNRAVIMGERSYGKGSVQNIQPFRATGGEIKLTTATFWRPSGKNLNKSSIPGYDKMPKEELETKDWGVQPDPKYTLKLSRQEEGELYEHLKDLEIIPRRDVAPSQANKKEFKDKQLEMAVDYLQKHVKMMAQQPSKQDAKE